MSDFPCLHGNERYGTCDDASTEIESIGLCQPKGVWTYSGNIPEYPVKNKIQDWRIKKMSKEKSEKDVRNVPITVRLNEEEHEKLKQCAAACGLSAAEFMRQLCKGNAPQPQPKTEFWELLNKLYEVHDAFKKCVPYYPTAVEICKEIEDFILELQQKTTLPQQFSVEELTEQGAV